MKQTIYELIIAAKEKINWEEIVLVAQAMGIHYWDSKEKLASKKELKNCLDSLLYSAEKSFYKNEQAGQAQKPVSIMSGGWHVTILTFSKNPIVTIVFGPWSDEQGTDV